MADNGNMIAPQGFGDHSQKPQMIKSVFNEPGDLVKDLSKSGLLKSVKDINVTLDSIKSFLNAQEEYFKISKEKMTENNSIPQQKVTVQTKPVQSISSIAKETIDTKEFEKEANVKDIKGFFSDWKYDNHKDGDWQKAILEHVGKIANNGWMKLLFILVTVGVVTLITKVTWFLKTLGVMMNGVKSLLYISGKIPIIGRFIKPFERIFDVFFNGFKKVVKIFDEMPRKIVEVLTKPVKIFLPIVKLLDRIGGVFGKITGSSAITNFSKSFLRIFEVLSEGGKTVSSVIGRFKGLKNFVAPIAKIFGIGLKFMKVIPVVGQIIAAIMSIFDAFTGWFDSDKIVGHVSSLGDKVISAASSVISGLLLGLIDTKTIAKTFEPLARIIDNIKTAITSFFDIFSNVSSFSDLAKNIKTFGIKLFDIVYDNIKQAFKLLFVNIPKYIIMFGSSMIKSIGEMFTKIGSWFSKDSLIGKDFNSIGSFFQNMGNSWEETVKMFESIISDFDNIKYMFGIFVDWFGGLFIKFAKFYKSNFLRTIGIIKSNFLRTIGIIKSNFLRNIGIMKDIFGTFVDWFGGLGDKFGNIFSTLGNVFSNIWEGIKTKVSKLGNNLKGAFSSIFDSIVSGLKNLPTSIANSIKGLSSTFASVFSNIPNMIIESIKSALDIIGSAKGLFDAMGFGDKNENAKTENLVVNQSQSPTNVPVSEKQTDNGENLQKVVEKKSTKTEEQSELTALNAQQVEFMKSMVELNKQMLSKMTPQSTIVFN